jgi:Cu-processing system permease protein
METIMFAGTHAATIDAAFRREIAEHRLNRFLHVHLTLCAVIGVLPLFTPDAAARSAPAWVLQAVLYCLSLSSLLLGLNAAHGDADEFPLLFTQPVRKADWLAGKSVALAALIGPAAALTVAPAAFTSGVTSSLAFVGAAAAGVCFVLALLGLAVGCWVRDHVRGLLFALGAWFVLLFGLDLLLLALSGSQLVQQHSDLWLLPLMLNPLSALRVTMLFTLERTAPIGIGTSPLTGWWLGHGGLWLAGMLSVWAAAMFGLGAAGAARRLDR